MKPNENLDPLIIGGASYSSRLLVGTGKYKDFAETRAAIEASGAQIVTVAIRRTNIGQTPGEPSLLEYIPPSKYTLLPNTAGCYTALDAVRTLRLARELLDGHQLVKLEVLGDPHTLYPNIVETLSAAKTLVAEGFKFKVFTPAESVKLASESVGEDFIEIVLDSTLDPPRVTGHTSRSRGRRSISSERPVKAGADPATLTEEDVLQFLVEEIVPFVER